MISYIRGRLTAKEADYVTVETGGIGYEISVPSGSSLYMTEAGEEVTVYIYMSVREDDIRLYGFSDKKELALFKQLITVSGVGARMAMSALSSMDAASLAGAIATEDAAAISRAPGIGKKMAQRIVLELRDKVDDVVTVPPERGERGDRDARLEALDGLMGLGYSRSEALNAMAGLECASAEEYIKKALRNLF